MGRIPRKVKLKMENLRCPWLLGCACIYFPGSSPSK